MSFFNLFILAISVLFLYYVFRNVNKNMVMVENALMWIFVAIIMVVFSLIDWIPKKLGNFLGFHLTSNFLLFIGVIFLLVVVFVQTIQISKQRGQLISLIQEISILKEEIKKGEKSEK